MKKNYIWIAILAVLLVVAIVFINKGDKKPTNVEANIVTALYTNDLYTVEALFDNDEDTVTFTEESLGTVTLPRAISASGARYANEDESIVFWEHQGELTITSGEEDVFVGVLVKVDGEDVQSSYLMTSDHPILGSWVWQKASTSEGVEIIPTEVDAFVLSFNNDGTVNSTTDCNNVFGQFEIEGNTGLALGHLASTKMYCEGAEEDAYVAELIKVVTYEVEGDTLTLGTAGGVMTFVKE